MASQVDIKASCAKHCWGVYEQSRKQDQWQIQNFPEVGTPTPRGGAPTYNFAKFPQKLHEIEEFGLGGVPRTPVRLDPWLRIAERAIIATNECIEQENLNIARTSLKWRKYFL